MSSQVPTPLLVGVKAKSTKPKEPPRRDFLSGMVESKPANKGTGSRGKGRAKK